MKINIDIQCPKCFEFMKFEDEPYEKYGWFVCDKCNMKICCIYNFQ